jgi:hypothetical protein
VKVTLRERTDTWTAAGCPIVEVLKVSKTRSLYRLLLQVAVLRVRVFASAAAGTIQHFLFETVAVRARVFGYICISAMAFVRRLCCPARLSGKLYASGISAQDRAHALEQHPPPCRTSLSRSRSRFVALSLSSISLSPCPEV